MNHKGNKTTTFVKSVFFVAFLGLASGCGGGSNPGQSLTADNSVTGSNVTVNSEGRSVSPDAEANHLSAKMDLCAEVNGWATDCRFVGMKYLKLIESITPLTEEFSGKNKGGGGEA